MTTRGARIAGVVCLLLVFCVRCAGAPETERSDAAVDSERELGRSDKPAATHGSNVASTPSPSSAEAPTQSAKQAEHDEPISRPPSLAKGPMAKPAVPVATSPVPQEPDAKRPREQQDKRFCLELWTPRIDVALGEPVPILVTLENCSSEPQLVRPLLKPEYGFLSVRIRSPKDSELRFAPPSRANGRGVADRRLEPNERLHDWFLISVGTGGWTLIEPGRYSIQARLAIDDKEMLSSERLRLNIRPPPTQGERRAARLFMRDETAFYFALHGGKSSSEGQKNLMMLADEYRETAVAPYADLVLGLSSAERRFDPEVKSFRGGDCEAATERLTRAVRRLKDPFYAAEGVVALRDCLRELKRASQAEDVVRRFYSAFPEAASIPELAIAQDGSARR